MFIWSHASTLVGLTRENLELDPIAVLHLDNQLYIAGNRYWSNHLTWLKFFVVWHVSPVLKYNFNWQIPSNNDKFNW